MLEKHEYEFLIMMAFVMGWVVIMVVILAKLRKPVKKKEEEEKVSGDGKVEEENGGNEEGDDKEQNNFPKISPISLNNLGLDKYDPECPAADSCHKKMFPGGPSPILDYGSSVPDDCPCLDFLKSP